MAAINNGLLEAEVAILVCDRPNAAVIEKAKKNQTPIFSFDPKQYSAKADFEREIIQQLCVKGVEWIILAGYMRLIGQTLLNRYEGKIINIHPSLLPSFPGLDAIGQAIEAGVKLTGVTIHYVDAGMDTGQIIAQAPVTISEDMSKADLQSAIQKVEHQLYPTTIKQLINRGKQL